MSESIFFLILSCLSAALVLAGCREELPDGVVEPQDSMAKWKKPFGKAAVFWFRMFWKNKRHRCFYGYRKDRGRRANQRMAENRNFRHPDRMEPDFSRKDLLTLRKIQTLLLFGTLASVMGLLVSAAASGQAMIDSDGRITRESYQGDEKAVTATVKVEGELQTEEEETSLQGSRQGSVQGTLQNSGDGSENNLSKESGKGGVEKEEGKGGEKEREAQTDQEAQAEQKEQGNQEAQTGQKEQKDLEAQEIVIHVQPQKYTQGETEKMAEEVFTLLPQEILGDNPDLAHVNHPLQLSDSVEGYPFSISWTSDDYELVDSEGNVKQIYEDFEEDEEETEDDTSKFDTGAEDRTSDAADAGTENLVSDETGTGAESLVSDETGTDAEGLVPDETGTGTESLASDETGAGAEGLVPDETDTGAGEMASGRNNAGTAGSDSEETGETDAAAEKVPTGKTCTTTLTATLSYNGWHYRKSFPVVVIPVEESSQERLARRIGEALEAQDKAQESQSWLQLPTEVEGKNLIWQEKRENSSMVIFVLILGAGILCCLLMDRKIEDEKETHKKNLQLEYPQLISKFVLFLGAGMSVRNVFYKLGHDYEEEKRKGAGRQEACEEILLSCRELDSGVSEAVVYGHFGQRCGIRQYTRLAALLVQDLRKGNSELLSVLQEEAQDAIQERRHMARALGEEAGTRLLMPMIMMLAVTMVIIIIPAFMGFS